MENYGSWSNSIYFSESDLIRTGTNSIYSCWRIGNDIECLIQNTTAQQRSPAVLEIRGTGAMYTSADDFVLIVSQDYDTIIPQWSVHSIACRFESSVVIPSGITSIAEKFLYTRFNPYFAHIVIGDDVEVIGTDAFYQSLGTIVRFTIASSKIYHIGDHAFQDNYNTTGLDFNGSSISYLGFRAFENCREVVDLNFGNINCNIKGRAFENCYKLQRFCIDNRIQGLDLSSGSWLGDVGNKHFYECRSLTDFKIDTNATFPTGATNMVKYFFVTLNSGIDCDENGKLKTHLDTTNSRALAFNWDFENRVIEDAAKPLIVVFDENQNPVIFNGYKNQKYVTDIPIFIEDQSAMYLRTVDINDPTGSGLLIQGDNNVYRRVLQ
jgi:hypothetical protein